MILSNYDYEEEFLKVTTTAIDKQFWDYFDVTATSPTNITETTSVLRDQSAVLITYSVLLAVGGVGNVAVLIALARSRRRKSRVDLMMTHLALADVCVTCGVIPLEIGWKYTNAWLVGNFLCKLLLVMRAFGLYLSSNVLVCISLDRFFAVIYPLRLPIARRRSKQMLYCAWIVAFACSLPQSIIFRVKRHPHVAGFEQCVSFGAFSSEQQEVVYNIFCLCAMYFLPLVVITVCYVCIFCEIHRSSRELDEKCNHRSSVGPVRLRRSDRRVLERARRRTLRMTVTIVAVFALCWLPYVTITMWYMIDRQSATRVSPRLQDLLFVMAVSNSCMNPLVYGSYTLDLRGVLRRLLKKTCCHSSAASDTIGNSGSSSMKNKNMNVDQPLLKTTKSSRQNDSTLPDGKQSVESKSAGHHPHCQSNAARMAASAHVSGCVLQRLRSPQFPTGWKYQRGNVGLPDIHPPDCSVPNMNDVVYSMNITETRL